MTQKEKKKHFFKKAVVSIGKTVVGISILALPSHGTAQDLQKAKEYYEKGKIELNDNAYEKAIKKFEKAIKKNVNYTDAYNACALAYINLNQRKKAFEFFNKALKTDPNSPYIHFNYGTELLMDGQYEKALFHLNKAIELDPTDPDAYYNRSALFFRKGDLDKAIADLLKIIEINPNYPTVYFHCGLTYEMQGNYAKAIENYMKEIEINPDFAKAYLASSSAYEELAKKIEATDPQKAAEYYKKAEENLQKGKELEQRENIGEIEELSKVIKQRPKDPIAYYNRGLEYEVQGEYEKAIDDYTKAIELDPNFIKAYFARSSAYEELARKIEATDPQRAGEYYKKAEEDYQKGMALQWESQ